MKISLKRLPFAVRIISALCAAVVLTASPFEWISLNCNSAIAANKDDVQAQIDKIKKENEARKKQIAGLNGDISKNKEAIKLINEQIDGVNLEIEKRDELILAKKQDIEDKQLEIESVENAVHNKELEIEGKKAHIAELQAKNKKNLERFAKLARVLYMNDTSGTMPILNGSDDWYDYFVYSDVIKNISGQNVKFMKKLLADIKDQEQLIEDLNAEITKLEQEKADLAEDRKKLEEDMAALKKSKKELDAYAVQQKAYLSELAAQNKELSDKVNALEYDEKVSAQKMEKLSKELEELIRAEQEKNNGQPVYSPDGFRWPLDPQFHRITTYFGWDNAFGGRNHGGIDIVGSGVSISSRNIYAAQSGKVIKVYTGCPHDYGKHRSCGCGGGWGNYVVIDHGGSISTLYAHCRKIYVTKGQNVTKGDVIAIVGTTGWSEGNHLHFEVREKGVRVDPFKYSYYDVY